MRSNGYPAQNYSVLIFLHGCYFPQNCIIHYCIPYLPPLSLLQGVSDKFEIFIFHATPSNIFLIFIEERFFRMKMRKLFIFSNFPTIVNEKYFLQGTIILKTLVQRSLLKNIVNVR